MPFIGNQPALSYTSFAKQDFTTSATTSYTLDHPVTNENELALFINFVRQEPTTAYSASGTSLTLTSATSASDDMYCVFLGKAVQTVNPPNGSVGTAQLVSGVLPDNTPYFRAYSASTQSISNGTATKVNFDNTNSLTTVSSGYDITNKQFLPTEAGTYFITSSIRISSSSYSDNNTQIYIYKNGSVWSRSTNDYDSASNPMITITDIVNLNGSSDYVDIRVYQSTGGSINLYTGTQNMYFSGYKLIGV